jgi:hypothetical protein
MWPEVRARPFAFALAEPAHGFGEMRDSHQHMS